MAMTVHERPGVYSSYDASAVVSGSTSGRTAGLVALCQKGTAGAVVRLTRYEEAVTAFGQGTLAELVRILLQNGASAVAAVPVREQAGYAAAFSALETEEDVAVVVCDSAAPTVQQALRDSVLAASENRRERLGVVFGGGGEQAGGLVSRAADLNCERLVLVGPGEAGRDGARVAAAVAGAIAGNLDPAVPLGGAELKGLGDLETQYTDGEIDLLVRGGVTPVERTAGTVSVVRGVTTRTKTGQAEDRTWRELSTILVVDDVIPAVRESLRAKFRRAKNTEQSRGAIRAQVIVELENRMDREIITGYDGVTVTALEEDPTVCVVEFSFTVAHGLNQIWLNAHIRV